MNSFDIIRGILYYCPGRLEQVPCFSSGPIRAARIEVFQGSLMKKGINRFHFFPWGRMRREKGKKTAYRKKKGPKKRIFLHNVSAAG
jgi:hypothetical protein